MNSQSKQVIICGAGIAGVSAAYHLAAVQGLDEILIVDERPPLSLTSDKSTECYRNWWPGPGDGMVSDNEVTRQEFLSHIARGSSGVSL